MKRILSFVLILFILCTQVNAAITAKRTPGLTGLSVAGDFGDGVNTDGSLDYSSLNPLVSCTRLHDATHIATVMDSSGVMSLLDSTQSNVPRISHSYRTSSGLVASSRLLCEAAATNYLKNSYMSLGTTLATNWAANSSVSGTPTASLVAVPELTSIAGANAQRIEYTGTGGEASKVLQYQSAHTAAGSFLQNDYVTISFTIKGTFTGASAVYLYVNRYNSSDASLGQTISTTNILSSISSTEFRKFTYTVQLTDATLDRISAGLRVNGVDDGDIFDYQFTLAQAEKGLASTSHIPTTTVSLSRSADVLRYTNVLNDEETIAIKWCPISSFSTSEGERWLYSTSDKNRAIYKASSANVVSFYPNLTDNSSVVANSTTVPAINTSQWTIVSSQHSSPYASIDTNSTNEGNYTAGDYTVPSAQAYFNLGCDSSNANQGNIGIEKIYKFNKVLSSAEKAVLENM